jgi:hypothetical protein
MPMRLNVRLVSWLWLPAAWFVGKALVRQRRPLSLRPAFLVPLLLTTPVISLRRLRRQATAA